MTTKRRINKEAVAARRRPGPRGESADQPPRQRQQKNGRQYRDALEWNWWNSQDGQTVELILTTGQELTGIVRFVATFSVCLNTEDGEVLILKGAIATVRRSR